LVTLLDLDFDILVFAEGSHNNIRWDEDTGILLLEFDLSIPPVGTDLPY
jgi:hypothetical protein